MNGYVYAVVFTNGTAKIGKTKSPGSRLSTLAHNAKCVGVGTKRIFLSHSMANMSATEAELISAASKSWKSISNESFDDVSALCVKKLFMKLKIPYIEILDAKRKVYNGKSVTSCTIIDESDPDDGVFFQEDEKTRDKLLRLMSEGLSLGVIVNRMRPLREKDIYPHVSKMIEGGIVEEIVTFHKKKGTEIKKYKVNLTP